MLSTFWLTRATNEQLWGRLFYFSAENKPAIRMKHIIILKCGYDYAMPSPEFIAKQILHWQKSTHKGFVTLEIYPTLRCNLNCSFCDTTDRHRPAVNELSTQEWIRIIDEAADLGAQQIFVLGGGEPTIRADLLHLLSHAKKRQLRGMLTTNGTLLSKSILLKLLAIGWDEIHFSIDGAVPETHDRLRGNRGAFMKAIRACCFLHRQKEKHNISTPQLVFHFVITNENYQEIPELLRLAKSVGVTRVDFDALIAYRPEQKQLELDPNQEERLSHIAQQAADLAEDLGIQTTLENFIKKERISRGITPPLAGDKEGLGGAPCLKAWHHLVIQADGRTSPCCVLAGQGGNIQGKTVLSLWNHDPFLENLREAMHNHQPPERCKECSWNILSHEREIRRFID